MWFAVLAAGCIITQLLAVEYHFNKIVDTDWLKHLSLSELGHLVANNIADASLLLLPLVALRARWRKWWWIVMWPFTLWCLAQLLYMPSYRDLMPISSLLLLDNAGDTLARSTVGALRLADLEVVLPPVILYVVYRIWFKKPMELTTHSALKRVGLVLLCLSTFAGIRLGLSALHYRADKECNSYRQQLVNDYCVLWTRHGDYLNQNGALPYIFYGIATSIDDRTTLTESQKKEVVSFLNEQPQYTDSDYATAQGKNVILLVVESLNSWAIGLEIDGREVTPTLNALSRDTVNNLVSLKMKSQVKNGRSSDGIFMYNTGLLPLTVQAVANTYGNVPYPSLAKSLGGYDCFYACCDEPTLWNVSTTARTYGYSDFYGKEQIREMVNKNGYLLDKALLDEVSELIPHRKSPFLALVATAGMHHPYNSPLKPTTWIQSSGRYTRAVRCYLECANAFDTALSQFLDDLKSKNLFDNTMIVIVSDHNEMIDDAPNGRPSIDREGDNCVFIAINSGQNGLIEGPIGQIDIFPTLMDLLGLNEHKWKGLGLSVMRNDICSAAVSPSVVAGSSPMLLRQQQAWRISDMIITSRWFEPRE